MDYIIYQTSMRGDIYRKDRIAAAATIDEAFEKLSRIGSVISFELDCDGYDAADAAVLMGRALEIFAIERAR